MNFLDPTVIIQTLGLAGVFAIIFAESGLFFGFFFPGDSLLFVAGLFAAKGFLNIYILVAGAIIAAILGDTVGYWFGRKIGPRLFTREDSLFFKKKYLLAAQKFYEHHGKRTIALARFVPIVRTFAPIVAGAAEMPYKTFFTYNVIGGVLWATLATMLGYMLGGILPESGHYEIFITLGIVLLSFIPPVAAIIRDRNRDVA